MANIAMITATGGIGGDNLYWKNRLVNTHGDTVTGIVDNDAETTDFSSYDIIYLGNGVDPNLIGANMKAELIPIVTMRQYVDTELGCANSNGNANNTVAAVQDNTHYITNVFSTGDVTFYNSSQRVSYWSGTSNDMEDLVTRTGYSDRPCIGVCDAGNTLNDGTTAAARRAIFGLWDDDDLHANAHTIFDRLRSWCLGEDAAAESGSADLSANFVIRKSSQADLSSNVTIQNTSQADLSSNVTIQNKGQYDQSANVTIRNKGQYDLSSNVTIQNRGQADLSSNATIQNKSQYDLSANVTIRNKDQADLSSNVTIQNKGQYDLSTNVTIQNVGQADLSASFTIGTDIGYIKLADAIVHKIPISSQTHTIELSNSIHNIVVTAAIHDIELSDQTHQIVISSEPLK